MHLEYGECIAWARSSRSSRSVNTMSKHEPNDALLASLIAKEFERHRAPLTMIAVADWPLALITVGLATVAAWRNDAALLAASLVSAAVVTLGNAVLAMYSAMAAHEAVVRWRRNRLED